MGIPAIAISQDRNPDKDDEAAAGLVRALVAQILQEDLPSGTFLNVNLPNCPPDQIRGIRVTRQGVSRLKETFHRRTDPRNQTYYWQGTETQSFDRDIDTDGAVLCKNYVSVTPIQCDMTDYGAMERIKRWDIRLTKMKT